ncbi:MAG: 6-phosphogluconolactonase [Acidobacteria bacterium]|nr:6-phosphogluconolactonase [Acidobacteriota bacterium]
MPTLQVIDSPAALADAVAAQVERTAAEAVAVRGRFAMAVAGGSVATTCFPRLVTAQVDWARTEVFFVDERAVRSDHPDSNYGLAHRLLLSRVPLRAGRARRMAGELAPVSAARRYEETLVRLLGRPPVLDLVLLGVGEDGHVASIFPGRQGLDAPGGWVAAVLDAPKPPGQRVTLTLPTLVAARRIIVAAMGPEKAKAVRAALSNPASMLPVARVAREAGDVRFITDAAAAS